MTTTRHRVVVNGVRRRVSRNDQFLRVANNGQRRARQHFLRPGHVQSSGFQRSGALGRVELDPHDLCYYNKCNVIAELPGSLDTGEVPWHECGPGDCPE